MQNSRRFISSPVIQGIITDLRSSECNISLQRRGHVQKGCSVSRISFDHCVRVSIWILRIWRLLLLQGVRNAHGLGRSSGGKKHDSKNIFHLLNLFSTAGALEDTWQSFNPPVLKKPLTGCWIRMSSTGLDFLTLLTKEHGYGKKAMRLHNISTSVLGNLIMVQAATAQWRYGMKATLMRQESGMIKNAIQIMEKVLGQFTHCVKLINKINWSSSNTGIMNTWKSGGWPQQ